MASARRYSNIKHTHFDILENKYIFGAVSELAVLADEP